jgi:hypothetical protein
MTFTRIHTEGDLIPTDTLEEITAGGFVGQQFSDFRPSRTTRLTERILTDWASKEVTRCCDVRSQ